MGEALRITVDGNEAAASVAHRLSEGGERHGPLPAFPGRRRLASAFRRLWKLCRLPNEGWSVSDAGIGNRD